MKSANFKCKIKILQTFKEVKLIKLLPDVDTGIDDALALFFLSEAQKQSQLEILGCTTVGGNAEVAQTSRNTHSKYGKWQVPKFQ